MPYTIDDLRRDLLKRLSLEERLQGLSLEEIEGYLEKLRKRPKKRRPNESKRRQNAPEESPRRKRKGSEQ